MAHERTKKKNKARASEMNLAAILLCIVFLFIVCHFPRIMLNVHEFFMTEDIIECGTGKEGQWLVLGQLQLLTNPDLIHLVNFGLGTPDLTPI
jgi:hypothetical protein